MNKVILQGHLGKDPEVKQVNGTDVAQFSIATTESWKDKDSGEKIEKTDWHNIVVWGASATFIGNYGRKGSNVLIEGKLGNRSYEAQDGGTRYITEVIVKYPKGSLKILDKKQD